MGARLTEIIKGMEEDIKRILTSNSSVVEKAVTLRRLARKIAAEHFDRMHFETLDAFYREYEKQRTPLTELEGEGVVMGDIIILKKCPMAPLFADFQENGQFPAYWADVPEDFMRQFKNESILHPLCIVHQAFRDELAGKISKGSSFVHSIAVACRAGSGKVVFSEFGLQLSGKTREEIRNAIEGMACAFHVR